MLRYVSSLIRFVVGWVWTVVLSTVACLLGLFLGSVGFALAWSHVCGPWARGAVRIAGCKVHVEGRENLRGPAIFATNHQGLIDVVLLPGILPATIKWVAKREISRIPLWGWAFRTGAVYVDRQDTRTAVRDIEQGLEGLPQGWSLAIFPEGTRSRDGSLGPLKKGVVRMALQTGLPVVPVGMHGAHDVVPPGGILPRPATVYLTFGDPIDASQWRHETRDQHLETIRVSLARCLERSKTRHAQGIQGEPLSLLRRLSDEVRAEGLGIRTG